MHVTCTSGSAVDVTQLPRISRCNTAVCYIHTTPAQVQSRFITNNQRIMTELTPTTTWELANSPHTPKTRIPCIGFGVYLASGGRASILTALAQGYRQLDTAQMYGNEEEVGHAVLACGHPRSELFVTTKVQSPREGGDCAYGAEETLENLRDSVRKCSGSKGRWEGGDGYVDLFLIHTPSCGPSGRKVLWEALEKLRAEGGTREIGVSN